MAADFAALFAALRPLLARHAALAVPRADEAGRYFLDSHDVRASDGYRTALGGVEIRKAYVSFHLMPVYLHPDLLDTISADLRKRMQGKSCFNFRVIDPALFAELADLVDAGVARFVADGRLPAPPAAAAP